MFTNTENIIYDKLFGEFKYDVEDGTTIWVNIGDNPTRYATYYQGWPQIYENGENISNEDKHTRLFQLINNTVYYPNTVLTLYIQKPLISQIFVKVIEIPKIIHVTDESHYLAAIDKYFDAELSLGQLICDNENNKLCYKLYTKITNFLSIVEIFDIKDKYYYFSELSEVNGLLYEVNTNQGIVYIIETFGYAQGNVMEGGCILFMNGNKAKCLLASYCGHPLLYFDNITYINSHGESDFPIINFEDKQSIKFASNLLAKLAYTDHF